MADTDPNPTAAAPAPVETAAAPAPVETAAAPAPAFIEPSAPVSDPRAMAESDKAFFRANIRWIMAELDYARSGRTAEERAQLNP